MNRISRRKDKGKKAQIVFLNEMSASTCMFQWSKIFAAIVNITLKLSSPSTHAEHTDRTTQLSTLNSQNTQNTDHTPLDRYTKLSPSMQDTQILHTLTDTELTKHIGLTDHKQIDRHTEQSPGAQDTQITHNLTDTLSSLQAQWTHRSHTT